MYSTILPTESNVTDGKDHRVIENKEKEIPILLFIKKRSQIQLLEDPSISILEKIEIIHEIENEGIYGCNLEKGGLWKDWY